MTAKPPQGRPETTPIPAGQEPAFQAWLKRNNVTDLDQPDSHYDYRGAFLAGINRGGGGHFPDTFKQHGHPTFSVESQYSQGSNDGGHWKGETFIPAQVPTMTTTGTPEGFADLHDAIDVLHNAARVPKGAPNYAAARQAVKDAYDYISASNSTANAQGQSGEPMNPALAFGEGFSRQAIGAPQLEPESKVPRGQQMQAINDQQNAYESAANTQPMATLAGRAIPAALDAASLVGSGAGLLSMAKSPAAWRVLAKALPAQLGGDALRDAANMRALTKAAQIAELRNTITKAGMSIPEQTTGLLKARPTPRSGGLLGQSTPRSSGGLLSDMTPGERARFDRAFGKRPEMSGPPPMPTMPAGSPTVGSATNPLMMTPAEQAVNVSGKAAESSGREAARAAYAQVFEATGSKELAKEAASRAAAYAAGVTGY